MEKLLKAINKNPEKFKTIALEISEKIPNHINDLRRLVMDEKSNKYDQKIKSYLEKPEFIQKSIQHAKHISKTPITEQVRGNLDASMRNLSTLASETARSISMFVENQKNNFNKK